MRTKTNKVEDVVILGAGLAGLTAGYVLTRSGMDVHILERDATAGGLAKTVHHGGFRFDLGGHRFITDSEKIERLVRGVLKEPLLVVPRSSKILLRNKYFDYPLKPLNALCGLGIRTSLDIIADYASEQRHARLGRARIVSLEDWVIRHYGRSMFEIFFKEYSEKIWGIPCNRIGMEWVAQRIQGMSLGMAIKNALFRNSGWAPRTLEMKFLYPQLGIGQIAEALKDKVEQSGRVSLDTRVVQINRIGNTIESVLARNGDENFALRAQRFVSSIPITTLVRLLHPKAPAEVLQAATRLKYRDLVIVTVMLKRPRVTDQTWIYIPDPEIPFGRIHEPTNWSRNMAPPGNTLLVTEHFCFRGDNTWSASDDDLVGRTVDHLVRLGLIHKQELIDRVVVRIPNAYPIFDCEYVEHYTKICKYLDQFENMHLIGRGGRFKYYNMDHAMESGVDVAERILVTNAKLGREQEWARTGTDR